MKITAILPVSRIQFLDKILESLEKQTFKPDNLLVVYDGRPEHFEEVRNKIVGLNYKSVLCVTSNNPRPSITMPERREHIASIHNQIGDIIGDCDWIFSMEDDSVLPPDALRKLVKTVQLHDDVGIVTGVELGRWGVQYVGAWKVNDLNNVTEVTSMKSRTSEEVIEGIDACGLYCALIRTDYYKNHDFFTDNGLGPDVNLALYLRREGFTNYIDWSIHVTHLLIRGGMETQINATDPSDVVILRPISENTWQASR